MEELLRNNLFATHAIAAAGAVTFATALTYPLDTLKVLVQVGSSSSKPLTSLTVLNRVRALSGYSGLYRGFGWLASGRVLSLGSRFGIYEILTAFYKDGREDNYVYTGEALLAGLAAGAVESLINSPFELIKLRAQVTSASQVVSSEKVTEASAASPLIAKLLRGYTPDKRTLNQSVALLSTLNTKNANLSGSLQEYPWMITGCGRPPTVCDVQTPSNIVSFEGQAALWRGLRSGLARDSLFSGVFFFTWQFLHRAMLDWKAVGMDPIPSNDEEVGPLSPLSVSLAAGFSGFIAAAASHGFDTAKSRSQCTILPKYITMERKLLKWRLPGNTFETFTGIHPSDRNVLYRGIWLRMTRSGLASLVMVGSYYFAVDYLVPD